MNEIIQNNEIEEVKSQSSGEIMKDLSNLPQGNSAMINNDIKNSPRPIDQQEQHQLEGLENDLKQLDQQENVLET